MQLLRHLNKAGVESHAVALGEHRMNTQPEDVAALMARPVRISFGGILLGYPTTYEKYTMAHVGRRVALTMFESSKIHPEWVRILNKLDAVIVPSLFCQDVFINCGVVVPIHVVPLGINSVYQPVKRDRERPLTFLAFLDRGARKGGYAAMQAFALAFGDRTDVKLVLKSRDPKTVRLNATNENVEIIQQDMTEQELADLYGRCDVLINANKGEGFGLIPREFAATGGIALATDWSGTADDLEQWGWPLPYSLVPAQWVGIEKFVGVDLGVWAEPDIRGVADVLLDVVDNRYVYQAAAYYGAENVHRLYSWEKFARGVNEVWESVPDASYLVAAG